MNNASETLSVLSPKQAATYCAVTGTVEAWRRQVSRRTDGTIRGFHDGAGTQWESYRMPIADAVKRAKKAAQAREYVKEENAAVVKAWHTDLSNTRGKRAELADTAASLPEALQNILKVSLNEMDAKIARLEGFIAEG